MNILILCAGFGTRLKPYSSRVPKPLVKIGEITALEYQIKNLKDVDYNNLFINTHYLADLVESVAKNVGVDKIFHEEEILGTAKPLKIILESGYDEDLLVINSDIYSEFSINEFLKEAKNYHMALLSVEGKTISYNEGGFLTHIGENVENPNLSCEFSGVSWYSKEALKEISEEWFSIVTFWKKLIQDKNPPKIILKNEKWIDMGTPQGLYEGAFEIAKKNGFLDENNNIWSDARDESLDIKNSLILETPKNNVGKIRNSIVGEDFIWKIEV